MNCPKLCRQYKKDYLKCVVPTTMDMAKPMIAKALAAIAAAAALAVIAVKIF